MKYLVIILTLLSLTASAQIDQAVDNRVNARISAAVKTAVDSIYQSIVWYDEIQKSVNGSGTIILDTLTAGYNTTEIYQLTVTGAGTAVRILFVTNTGGKYTLRVTNPASYSGASGTAFNATVSTSGVVVSLTGNNTIRSYKYNRKNL
jgi:hypothetical protein